MYFHIDSIGITYKCTRKKLVWSFFLVHLIIPIESIWKYICKSYKVISYRFYSFVSININSSLHSWLPDGCLGGCWQTGIVKNRFPKVGLFLKSRDSTVLSLKRWASVWSCNVALPWKMIRLESHPRKQGDYCTVQLWLSVKLMNLNFKDQLKAKLFSL